MKFKLKGHPDINKFGIRTKYKSPTGVMEKKIHVSGGTWIKADDLSINVLMNGEIVKVPVEQDALRLELYRIKKSSPDMIEIIEEEAEVVKDEEETEEEGKDLPRGKVLAAPEPYEDEEEGETTKKVKFTRRKKK